MQQRFRVDGDIFENAPPVDADIFETDKKRSVIKNIWIRVDEALIISIHSVTASSQKIHRYSSPVITIFRSSDALLNV